MGLDSLLEETQQVTENNPLERLQSLLQLLPEEGCSFQEADSYSVKFLKGKDYVNRLLLNLRNARIQLERESKIAFSLAFDGSPAKTVTEKREVANMNPSYLQTNAIYNENENKIKYYKGLYEIFDDAHKYYKNLARDQA